MSFEILATFAISICAFISCQYCKMGRQIESLSQCWSCDDDLCAVPSPEHTFGEFALQAKHRRVVWHCNPWFREKSVLQIAEFSLQSFPSLLLGFGRLDRLIEV